MNQLYFLVKDEDELRDKVWKALFEKMINSSVTLIVEPLEVEGADRKLFKVSWWESYKINNMSGTLRKAVEVTQC